MAPVMSFYNWMEWVDANLYCSIGVRHSDLAHHPWSEWYDNGMVPVDAARRAIDLRRPTR